MIFFYLNYYIRDKRMNIEVKTNAWVLPNRVGYNKKMYDIFHPSKYHKKAAAKASCECTKDSCELDVSKVSLFPQQRIVAHFFYHFHSNAIVIYKLISVSYYMRYSLFDILFVI